MRCRPARATASCGPRSSSSLRNRRRRHCSTFDLRPGLRGRPGVVAKSPASRSRSRRAQRRCSSSTMRSRRASRASTMMDPTVKRNAATGRSTSWRSIGAPCDARVTPSFQSGNDWISLRPTRPRQKIRAARPRRARPRIRRAHPHVAVKNTRADSRLPAATPDNPSPSSKRSPRIASTHASGGSPSTVR